MTCSNKAKAVASISTIVLVLTSMVQPVSNVSLANTASSYVRVNQVGYPINGAKRAYLMTNTKTSGSFEIRIPGGGPVDSFPIGADQGPWNGKFQYVYVLDFDAFNTPGEYIISAGEEATSPHFKIDTPANLYGLMLENAEFYFQAQRDGPEQVDPPVLSRRPAHLNDEKAKVYYPPIYVYKPDKKGWYLERDLDEVAGAQTRDVSGGWYDAGDYVKFVHNTAYALDMTLVAVRDHPNLVGDGQPADFHAEAQFGLDWLQKMWVWDKNAKMGTFYYQVGIGDGNGEWDTPDQYIAGDHDIWRLPEDDDDYTDPSGWYPDKAFKYIRNRPLLRAYPPIGLGEEIISPNLAGRVSAALALCYQIYKGTDKAYADQCLISAQQIFALADTTPDELLTASPKAYYPEYAWEDDMELGAAELYFAVAQGAASDDLPADLLQTDPAFYLKEAARWANEYITGSYTDTLNLYDVSALAHYELHKAITHAGNSDLLPLTQTLAADLERQLKQGEAQAQKDPFGYGFDWAQFDTAVHGLGFAITASMYQELTGDTTYAGFAQRQLDDVLGANAWGTAFIIGAGDLEDEDRYPFCPQNQIANLSGHLDGTPPILKGAVVNGPNSMEKINEVDPYIFPTMNECPPSGSPPDPFQDFNTTRAGYRDDVRYWPTVENAVDFAATSVLALARQVGTLLSQDKMATASSFRPGYEPGKAVDGDGSTSWASRVPVSDPEWIYVDLGTIAKIDQVVLEWWGNAYGKEYQVLISNRLYLDPLKWTVLHDESDGNGGIDDLAVSGTGRYVGVYATRPYNSSNGYSLVEFQAYGTTTSALLSQNKPAVASSSQPGFGPGKAVDGDSSTTRWASQAPAPEYLYVDLGANKTIGRVVLNWDAAYAMEYTIYASYDASKWTPLYTESNGNGGIDDLPVSGTGRYIGVYARRPATAQGYSLREFQVYEFNTGTLLSQGKPAVASSSQPGFEPAKAVDGSLSTRWASQAPVPEYLYVDLGAMASVDRVVLTWADAYATEYDIYISNDPSNWKNWKKIFTVANGNGHKDDLSLPAPETGRYIGVYARKPATTQGHSLWEFQAYGALH